MGKEILLNGFSLPNGLIDWVLQPPLGLAPNVIALIAKQIPYITTFITHIKRFITILNIGYINATKCKIIIKVINVGVSSIKSRLSKKNKKSKFLTPSLTGNLFVVVVHRLSVISFIPKCLLLLNPHFHLSIKFATV